MSDLILIDRHDGWAEIVINRADKRNAMNREARRGLLAAFEALREDVRAIIITGSGASFCAGMDLKEIEQDRAAGIAGSSQEWIDVNIAIREHPAVFIAAVNGVALGGGSTLINVCDLALACPEASIGCPEMGFATYPGMAGPAAQLSGITRKRAAWMILTATRIDGAMAERWGMVNECVPQEELMPRARQIAAQLAQFDPVALAESKKALDRIPNVISTWREAMAYGQSVNMTIRAATDAQDKGRARFADGRKNPGQGV